MIQRFLTVYLPAAVVLTIATTAAVFLYRDADPELEEVGFVTAENELRITNDELDATVGAIHELPQQSDDAIESDVSVETYHGTSPSQEINRPDIRTTAEQTEPTVVTIGGPGASIRCEIDMTGPKTAHQVMQQAAEQCQFAYQTKRYASLGVFVDSIAGVTSDKSAGRYWIYYVNDVKAKVGVSSYQVQPGDVVSWRYEQEY